MKPLRILALAALLTLALTTPAMAKDPGRWTLTGWSSLPTDYWQGVTSAGPTGPLYFSGFTEGLYGTNRTLRQTGAMFPVVPPTIKALEGYNHVGDISYDIEEGGRVLLPLECYTPGGPNGGNTCGNGAIGVADPATLAFRYYVKLDPAEIAKAMWVESGPDGFLWTSSGNDLLAYRAVDVSAPNAAPAAPIHSVKRLVGAVPPSGVTGAAIRGGRLYLAGSQGTTYQVWSVDLANGSRRLELELPNVQGEAEGLHVTSTLGGKLHFLVAPLAIHPTFGSKVALLHFTPAALPGLRVKARAKRPETLRPVVSVRVTRRGRPVRGATVTVAGKPVRTDAAGRAKLRLVLDKPGSFAALARRGRLQGRSKFLALGAPPAPARARSAARLVPLR